MTVTDATLLERWIRSRDADAFNEIITRHADLVFSACRRIVQNHADAEDIAQNCFLKLANAGSPPRSSVVGWLYRTATRSAIDCLRMRSRRKKREGLFEKNRARVRAEKEAWKALQEHVDACIAELPEELSGPIIAHFLQRKTHEDIAGALGVSRQTVTHRIKKGIERIRHQLKKRGAIISGATLTAFLGQSMVEAAPPAVLASLGRIALSAPSLAAKAEPVAKLSLIEKAGGIFMAKKVVISSMAAVLLFVLLRLFVLNEPSTPDPMEPREPAVANGPSVKTDIPTESHPVVRTNFEPGKAGDAVDSPAGPQISLAGTVVAINGYSVSGAAIVIAAGQPGRPRTLLKTKSDETGAFSCQYAGPGEVTIYGYKPGIGLGTAAGEPLQLEIVLKPLCTVGGRFYERGTGEGIAGLAVKLSRTGASEVAPEALMTHSEASLLFPEFSGVGQSVTTDRNGRYLFQDVSPLHFSLEFNPDKSEYVLPGYGRHDPLPAIALSPGQRKENVDFALQRGGAIAGTVFGPDDLALPGALVRLVSSFPAPRKRALRSKTDGTFHFMGLAPNATYTIHAAHEGLSPGESDAMAMPEAEVISGVAIQLFHGGEASGRFVDDAGDPVQGLDVSLTKRSGPGRKTVYFGSTTTKADGSFSFNDVAPGKYSLQVRSKVHLTNGDFSFTMPEGEDLPDLEFVIKRKSAGFISGTVVNPSDEPVPGIMVCAKLGPRIINTARSQEDGTFHIGGLGDAGAYKVFAQSGSLWSERKINVPLNASDLILVVKERGTIRGRVVDAETGKPIENFEARAAFFRPLPGGGKNAFHLKWTPFASKDGAFQFEKAEPVEAEIQVRAEDCINVKSPRFMVPAGAATDIMVIPLNRGTVITGTVLDEATSEPIQGVRIRLHQQDTFYPWLLEEAKVSYARKGVWKLKMSRADGRFEFGGLEHGQKINCVAWKKGYGTVVIPGIATEPEGHEINISMSREGTVLLSPAFHARPGQWYEFVLHHQGKQPERTGFYAATKADKPGPLAIKGLPPGLYKLAVYSVKKAGEEVERRLVADQSVQIDAGENREIPLELNAATSDSNL